MSLASTIGAPVVLANKGEEALDPLLQPFVNQAITFKMGTPEGEGLNSGVDYRFDGDVLSSDPLIEKFVHADQTVMNLQYLADASNTTGKGAVSLDFDRIGLSTQDLPGSFGYSSMAIEATQDGVVVWTWTASVSQGSTPIYDALPGTGELVHATPDRLAIQHPHFVIPVTLDSANRANLEVKIYMEQSGKRT